MFEKWKVVLCGSIINHIKGQVGNMGETVLETDHRGLKNQASWL